MALEADAGEEAAGITTRDEETRRQRANGMRAGCELLMLLRSSFFPAPLLPLPSQQPQQRSLHSMKHDVDVVFFPFFLNSLTDRREGCGEEISLTGWTIY